jgi:hypothetical protein
VSNYLGVSAERLIQVARSAVAAAPAHTEPAHFILSPRTSRGLPTSGFALTLLAPARGAAVATTPGFTITIYRAIPVLGAWAALQAFPGANYGDQLVLPDISGGMALYFVISHAVADGDITTADPAAYGWGPAWGHANVILAIAELD